jgi:hypothetical protein
VSIIRRAHFLVLRSIGAAKIGYILLSRSHLRCGSGSGSDFDVQHRLIFKKCAHYKSFSLYPFPFTVQLQYFNMTLLLSFLRLKKVSLLYCLVLQKPERHKMMRLRSSLIPPKTYRWLLRTWNCRLKSHLGAWYI